MGKFDQFNNVDFDALRERVNKEKTEQENKGKGASKAHIFKPKLPEKQQKITFVIRVLPNVHQPENKFPWVDANAHMFRRADGKFIYTICPSTFQGKGAPCPICEKSKKYFATQDKADEKIALDHYIKPRHFLNVLVVEDSRKGDDNQEGKVLIWEIGKKICEKLSMAFTDRKINFWSPLKGHNFRLVITRQGEYDNYDNSEFDFEATPISKDNKEMDRIFDEIHDLQEKAIGKTAHSYEKLQEILDGTVNTRETTVNETAPRTESKEVAAPKTEVKKDVAKAKPTPAVAAAPAATPDEDFDFNFDDDKK